MVLNEAIEFWNLYFNCLFPPQLKSKYHIYRSIKSCWIFMPAWGYLFRQAVKGWITGYGSFESNANIEQRKLFLRTEISQTFNSLKDSTAHCTATASTGLQNKPNILWHMPNWCWDVFSSMHRKITGVCLVCDHPPLHLFLLHQLWTVLAVQD